MQTADFQRIEVELHAVPKGKGTMLWEVMNIPENRAKEIVVGIREALSKQECWVNDEMRKLIDEAKSTEEVIFSVYVIGTEVASAVDREAMISILGPLGGLVSGHMSSLSRGHNNLSDMFNQEGDDDDPIAKAIRESYKINGKPGSKRSDDDEDEFTD